MTRGFVTVATGNENYYRQAYNLLQSFRLFHPDVPFAILCDRENEYTGAFTDTVILPDAKKNYLDKFFLLTECPYDESIFIESDCLVYHSLGHFWDLLARDFDFTSFGWNDGALVFFSDSAYAAEKFLGDPDACVPIFNPGYMFIRKGEVCRQIYRDAMRLIREITDDPKLAQDPKLTCKGSIRDDPVFALAMKLNGCECAEDSLVGKCVSLPSITKINQISLSRGKLDVVAYASHTVQNDCNILHFSSRRTREEGLYAQQVLVLRLLYRHSGTTLVRLAESRPVFLLLDVYKKGCAKAKHMLKRFDK